MTTAIKEEKKIIKPFGVNFETIIDTENETRMATTTTSMTDSDTSTSNRSTDDNDT